MAIKSQKLESIKFLLSKDAKVFINDPIWNEMSPIFYAIRLENLEIVKLICQSDQGKKI
jgi:hypothetical protein